MKTLWRLFEHHLKNMYSAEIQLIDAWREIAQNVQDKKLKKTFKALLKETKEHKNRLEDICNEMDMDPEGVTCETISELINELKAFIKLTPSYEILNTGLIAKAQKIEHYKIAAYGTAEGFARELGMDEIAIQLKTTLNEECNIDSKLTAIAESKSITNAI